VAIECSHLPASIDAENGGFFDVHPRSRGAIIATEREWSCSSNTLLDG